MSGDVGDVVDWVQKQKAAVRLDLAAAQAQLSMLENLEALLADKARAAQAAATVATIAGVREAVEAGRVPGFKVTPKKAAAPPAPDPTAPAQPRPAPGPGNGHEGHMSRQGRREALAAFMATRPPMKSKEIAAALGWNESTVKQFFYILNQANDQWFEQDNQYRWSLSPVGRQEFLHKGEE